MGVATTTRWNHNIHYHPLIRAAVGSGPGRRVLEVGCGAGGLARELRSAGARVTAIDRHEPSIDTARLDPGGVEYVHGDFLRHPLPVESFDAVVSVAVLHHMDAAAGLRRMRQLVRPGGQVIVIGCARSELPRDALWEALAVIAHRVQVRLLRRPLWEHSAPQVWPPPLTYREMRRIARRELPGVRWRRRALWRYSLVWTKPA